MTVIEECNAQTWEDSERKWIKFYRDNGYNVTNIADGGNHSASYGRLGKKNSPEHIAKTRAGRLGKPTNTSPEGKLRRADGIRRYCKD